MTLQPGSNGGAPTIQDSSTADVKLTLGDDGALTLLQGSAQLWNSGISLNNSYQKDLKGPFAVVVTFDGKVAELDLGQTQDGKFRIVWINDKSDIWQTAKYFDASTSFYDAY